jgi:hypothetical protein
VQDSSQEVSSVVGGGTSNYCNLCQQPSHPVHCLNCIVLHNGLSSVVGGSNNYDEKILKASLNIYNIMCAQQK